MRTFRFAMTKSTVTNGREGPARRTPAQLMVGMSLLMVSAQTVNAQWQQMTMPFGGKVYALKVIGNRILAGTGGGILISTDAGTTWKAANTQPANMNTFSFAMNGTSIFEGGAGSVYRSDDSGDTWQLSDNGIPQPYEPLAKVGKWAELRWFSGACWSGQTAAFGLRGRQAGASEVQFAAVEQFPLDLLAGLQTDGRRQRQREVDVQAGLLALGTDGLNFQRILGLHGHKLAYKLTPAKALRRSASERHPSARRTDERVATTQV